MFEFLQRRARRSAEVAPEAKPEAHPQQVEIDKVQIELAHLGAPPEADFDRVKNMLAEGNVDGALEFAASINLDDVLNVLSERFHDFTREERLIYAEARNVTLATPQAIVSLARAVRYLIDNDVPGAFVECGVFLGGSIIVMIRTLLLCGRTDRDIYLFDTFEGMPRPDDRDVFYTGEPAAKSWEFHQRGADDRSNWVYAPIEDVTKRVLATGYPAERIHFVKGMVEDTLPQSAPGRIAMLRLDTDFYSSTKHEFVHLYPRLAEGGVVIVDDYGAFRGSQLATDEYIAEQKLPIFLNRIDENVRLAVKVGRPGG